MTLKKPEYSSYKWIIPTRIGCLWGEKDVYGIPLRSWGRYFDKKDLYPSSHPFYLVRGKN